MQVKLIWSATLVAFAVAPQATSNAQPRFYDVLWPTPHSAPAVSERYLALTSSGGETQGGFIYPPSVTTVGKNPPTDVIAGDTAPVGTFGGLFGPARISGDRLAFFGYFGLDPPHSSGVFTKSGETLTTISKTGDLLPSTELPIEGFGRDVAVSQDRVAFSASYAGGSQQGIFVGSGGALTTIARTGDVSSAGTLADIHDGPAIRGSTVAFASTVGDDTTTGIFVGNGGELTTIAVTGDPAPVGVFDAFGAISMGSGNVVSFSATYDGGAKSGIFKGIGGPLVAVAKTGDVVPGYGTIESLTASAMSGSTVAFLADGSGGPGIFTSDGSGRIQLQGRVTDLIGGAPWSGPSMDRFGFHGDHLAFSFTYGPYYHFGILTVSVIPEPATWLLAAMALAALLRR
jgi:hypothetical protein